MRGEPVSLPKDFAGAINLVAHPMAGAAALSALSFGVASQMFGIWVGAVTGLAEASQRMLTALDDDESAPAPDAHRETIAAVKARAAARTLTAGVEKAVERTPATPAKRPALTLVAAKAAPQIVRTSAKPATVGRPDTPDDLKLISGIGPKLQSVLNSLGIWTFAQIAAWNTDEIAWVDNYLSFSGRILRDGWTEQAAGLAGGNALAER